MTPDELDWLAADVREEAQLMYLLDLIAWTICQRRDNKPLHLSDNWPDAVVFANPLLRWIAQRDPDLFDVARFQLSDAMKTQALGTWAANVNFAATLLAASPPNRRGALGENVARDALILALSRHVENSSNELRTLRHKQDGFCIAVADRALAERCYDLLAEHEWLADETEVPSPDAIRPILGKREEWRERHGLSWDVLDSVTS